MDLRRDVGWIGRSTTEGSVPLIVVVEELLLGQASLTPYDNKLLDV